MVINRDHAVELFTYESEEEMRSAWAEFEKTIENDEPDGDDFILWKYQEGSGADLWRISQRRDYPELWIPDPDHRMVGFGETKDALTFIEHHVPEQLLHDCCAWVFTGGDYLLLDWP